MPAPCTILDRPPIAYHGLSGAEYDRDLQGAGDERKISGHDKKGKGKKPAPKTALATSTLIIRREHEQSMLVPWWSNDFPWGTRIRHLFTLLKENIIFLAHRSTIRCEPDHRSVAFLKRRPERTFRYTSTRRARSRPAWHSGYYGVHPPRYRDHLRGAGCVHGGRAAGQGAKATLQLPNSRIMIHQPSMQGLAGQAADIDIYAARFCACARSQFDAGVCHRPADRSRGKDVDRDYIMEPDRPCCTVMIDRVMRSAI